MFINSNIQLPIYNSNQNPLVIDRNIPILGSSGPDTTGKEGNKEASQPNDLSQIDAQRKILFTYVDEVQKTQKTVPVAQTTGTNTNLAQGSNLNPFLGAESQIKAGNRLNTIA